MRHVAILLGLAALVGFGPATSASVARPGAQAPAARLGPEPAPPTEATKTEEGIVMATTRAYVMQDLQTSRRGAILAEFRSSARIQRLFEQGVRERSTRRDSPPAATLQSR